MKLFKAIFSGVLIATAVSTLAAMEKPQPVIDCFHLNTKEAFINLLTHHQLIDAAFDVNESWKEVPELISKVWRVDKLSRQSMLDAYARINRGNTLVTPDSVVSVQVPKLSYMQCLANWIMQNKSKSVGIGIITFGVIDALQAYVRVDKASWNDSELKGKLELMRPKMLCVHMGCKAYRFLKSRYT